MDILIERAGTHGSFSSNARVSQAIKEALAEGDRYEDLPFHIKEALDCVAFKLSRVVSGDWSHEDHFEDIIGYSRLALDYIARVKALPNVEF